MSKNILIRCGEKNNFNFTAAEIEQLRGFSDKGDIFVNSNSFVNITAEFPAIITINPYLRFVEPKGDLSNVKAYRLKWVCGANQKTSDEQEEALIWAVAQGVPVLVTFMRFKSYASLETYANKEPYKNNAGWLRPTEYYRYLDLSHIHKVIAQELSSDLADLVYTCDMSGHGCPSCNNCIRLVVGDENVDDYEVKSLNLSTSGDNGKCIFNCPDCWAKNILKMVKNQTPRCNVLFANRKQKGEISHE